MQDTPRIVVGLELDRTGKELSRGSEKALEQAMWLARARGGQLICAHARGGERFVEKAAGVVLLMHEGVPEEGRQALEAAVAACIEEGVEARLELLDERPVLGLVRLVMSESADLLVVGRHDTAEDGPRIGSVAQKLLRKCPAPVWVVKPGHSTRPERVLAATDLTPTGRQAVELGCSVAKQAEAEMHVVHSFQITMEEQFSGEDSDLDLLRRRDQLGEQIREDLAGDLSGLDAELHVLCNAPERGIQETIKRVDPDVLVIGSVSRGGIAGFLIGNTAERVLPKTTCSLLVVKPDDFVSPIKLED